MAAESRYRVDTPRVVHEVFDEEVVVLDLESGSYYSLRGSAARIFEAAASGSSSSAIASAFATGPDAGVDAPAAVDAFLDSLVAEGLLLALTEPAALADPIAPAPGAEPFTLPRFEKFTDMKDLLLLDPIHDVDETGWPRAAAKARGSSK